MHPQARNGGLLTTMLPNGEVVVYDVERESYEHLSSTCGCVWQHCDGATSVDRLVQIVAQSYDADNAAEIVELALEELSAGNLLTVAAKDDAPQAIGRRDALQRLAARGVAVAMLPVITTFAVPRDLAAHAVGSAPPPPPPLGDQGCSLGYWKDHSSSAPGNQQDAWGPTGYTTGTLLTDVFFPILSDLASKTLLDALSFGGGSGELGGARILLKQAAASLLNASHPDVSFGMSKEEVILQVNVALATRNREAMIALGVVLEVANNKGCPLS